MKPALLRTTAANPGFQALITLLDEDLRFRYGPVQLQYDGFNKVPDLQTVVVVFENGIPAACGAIKQFDYDSMEIKRMFTRPDFRGKGFASLILRELETWALELGCRRCVLETGTRQTEAIPLYKKLGYTVIPNYGPYVDMEFSVCFEKILS